jgi:hypothetical protein
MARKSSGRDSDGPSTADVSAHEDVEMQDQDDKMNGFKKFGVSASSLSCARPPFRRQPAASGGQGDEMSKQN